MSEAQASSHGVPFGGPAGNFMMIFALPIITAYLYFCVRWNGGALLPGADSQLDAFFASLRPTWQAAAAYLAWFLGQAALQQWAPGKIVEGTPLPDGRRLPYKMNGLASLVITFAVVAALHLSGVARLRLIYDHFGALLSSMTLLTFAFSAFLFVYGKRHGQAGPLTGYAVSDFFL